MHARYHMGKPAHLRPEKQSAGGILLPISIQRQNWEECLRDARAAIEAMRVPTDEIMAASFKTWRHGYDGNPREVYGAMIDAALNP